jgi:hypothetical protein
LSRRYTLTDCYTLLHVDPKTFRRWLEKAALTPQVSRADDRVKYLTQEQVEELAKLHDRQLPETIPQQDAPLAPGTYKLVLDQIEALQQIQREAGEQVQVVQQSIAALSEEVHQYHNEQAVQGVSLETLRVLTEHTLKEMEQSIQAQEQGMRKQKEELKAYTQEQIARVSRSVNLLTERVEQQQQETESTLKSLEQQFREKIAYLELALAQITDAFTKEQEARLALEQQVATLQAGRKPVPRNRKETQGNNRKL